MKRDAQKDLMDLCQRAHIDNIPSEKATVGDLEIGREARVVLPHWINRATDAEQRTQYLDDLIRRFVTLRAKRQQADDLIHMTSSRENYETACENWNKIAEEYSKVKDELALFVDPTALDDGKTFEEKALIRSLR